jgi:tetratricopeptide (TPR) repeat protein
MALARGCEQEENVESIKTWLSGKDNWLLIMDNADDQFLDISRFFPAGNRGSIVITTRNPDFQRYATVGSYKVDRMHPEDAITLLLKGAAVQDTQNAETRKLAREVVDVLGCLALAIIQAAAVLRQQLCSLSGFCELYSRHKQELLESGRPLPTDDYQYSVYTTWEISIKKIQDITDTHARLALELLQTFSFMHFEGIHEDFFKTARKHVDLGYWGSWESFVRELLFIKCMPSGWDPLLMGKALGLLVAFSLVNIDENRRISMHPLVHEWSRDRISDEDRQTYWLITVATLAISTKREPDLFHYKERRWLLPHVDFCLGYQDDQLLSDGPDLRGRLDAAFLFVVVYYEGDQWEKALNLSLNELKWREILYTPGDRTRSATALHTTRILSYLGRNYEAVVIQTQMEEELGKVGDNKMSLLFINGLATSYLALDKPQKAVDKTLEALAKFETIFGPEHQDILETKHLLASGDLALGRPKQALKLAEKVLEARMRLYTEQHNGIISSSKLVAEAFAALKLLIRARRAQEMYLHHVTEIYGPNHPRTIYGLDMMANYQNRYGRLMHRISIRGLICRREVVERSNIAFGKTDPRTVRFMEALARDYFYGFAFAKAEAVQEQVVKEKVKTFGNDHEDAVGSRYFLGQIRNTRKVNRAVYWWLPEGMRDIEFWYDGAGPRLFRKSRIIAGV